MGWEIASAEHLARRAQGAMAAARAATAPNEADRKAAFCEFRKSAAGDARNCLNPTRQSCAPNSWLKPPGPL
jgi:hypothetical protein